MTPLKLIELAFEAQKNSYSPYSDCKVGAALLCKNGKAFLGCNIENASYSPTNCAERTAFFKAISEGETDFLSIAIVGSKNNKTPNYFVPCGVCRQVMKEFCNVDFKIIVARSKNDYKEFTLNELLPHSFGKEELI